MAVEISAFVAEVKKEIEFEDLAGKRIAIDAYNTIYQFLSIIRQPDGSPLTDAKGRVTSHLSGLLYRTTNLIGYRISPVFVFDGIPPELKRRTLEARAARRREAAAGWERARAEGALAEARTHAVASTKIDREIVESSKQLLEYMGVPYIQAPSEGEAQAAQMVRDGLVYASASQDYDSFLFGADVVIRNFTLTGKRRMARSNAMADVKLDRILLKELLSSLSISLSQLIWIGILIGTDFDSGIDRVGPKTALKIVREAGSLAEVEELVKSRYGKSFDVDVEEVERIFTQPDTLKMEGSELDSMVRRAAPKKSALVRFMCDEHGFMEERISRYADRLVEAREGKGQRGMEGWL